MFKAQNNLFVKNKIVLTSFNKLKFNKSNHTIFTLIHFYQYTAIYRHFKYLLNYDKTRKKNVYIYIHLFTVLDKVVIEKHFILVRLYSYLLYRCNIYMSELIISIIK